jgi:hypothetical protein
MTQRIKELLEQIRTLENELKKEIDKEESKIPVKIKGGRVWFDKETLARQRKELITLFRYITQSPLLYIITAPIIYAVVLPALVLDLFVTIYQHINFRVYKIPLVKRSDYIVFDRHYLGYLNVIEKLNCLYCSYFNGLMAYAGEVAARTEQFWCPIKHAKKVAYRHRYYDKFVPYADEHYHHELEALRKELQQIYEKQKYL